MKLFRKKTQELPPVASGEGGEIGYKERLKASARALAENLAWKDVVAPTIESAIKLLETEILDNERFSPEERERLIAARWSLKNTWSNVLSKVRREGS